MKSFRPEDVVIALVSAALTNSERHLNIITKISKSDWTQIYEIACMQGVVGIIFPVMEKMPKEFLPDSHLLLKWIGHVEHINKRNQQYNVHANEFLGRLKHFGIEVVVLKGTFCAGYYPQPNNRLLGDLDIYPINVDSTTVDSICRKHGLYVEQHDYKHSKILYKGLTIENHKYCTEIRGAQVKKDFEIYLRKLLYNGNIIQFNALFLMAHAFNHFLDEGLNLRQICDWAMFIKHEQNRIDWNDFNHWMRLMHMYKFAGLLNCIVSEKIGVSINNSKIFVSSFCREKMMSDIFYVHRHLHNRGLKGFKFRMAQMQNTFGAIWKYNDICEQNVGIAYMKNVWYYFTEKKPTIE